MAGHSPSNLSISCAARRRALDFCPGSAHPDRDEELAQLAVLEEYAAMVEAASNVESLAPFDDGGLAMQEALTHLQTSLERLEKRGSSDPHVPEATQATADHCAFAGGEARSAGAHQSHARLGHRGRTYL